MTRSFGSHRQECNCLPGCSFSGTRPHHNSQHPLELGAAQEVADVIDGAFWGPFVLLTQDWLLRRLKPLGRQDVEALVPMWKKSVFLGLLCK